MKDDHLYLRPRVLVSDIPQIVSGLRLVVAGILTGKIDMSEDDIESITNFCEKLNTMYLDHKGREWARAQQVHKQAMLENSPNLSIDADAVAQALKEYQEAIALEKLENGG